MKSPYRVALLVSLVANAWLVTLVLDGASSNDGCRTQQAVLVAEKQFLLGVADATLRGMSSAQAAETLSRSVNDGHSVRVSPEKIEASNFVACLRNGIVINVIPFEDEALCKDGTVD